MNFNSQHISVFFAFKIINHLTTNSSAQTLPHSSEVVGQLRDHRSPSSGERLQSVIQYRTNTEDLA